jgi:hypothetical protein
LFNNNESVSEETVKLLNTVSLNCEGRIYLLNSNHALIGNLIDALQSTTSDSQFRTLILETLHKLSLRYNFY